MKVERTDVPELPELFETRRMEIPVLAESPDVLRSETPTLPIVREPEPRLS